MHLVLDADDRIVGSAAEAAEIEFFDGYGTAPGGVTFLGAKEAFRVVEANVTGDVLGRFLKKGKAVNPALPEPEVQTVPGAVVDPEAAFELYKTVVIARMTDAECDAFDFELSTASARERRMWIDCDRLISTDPYFAALKAKFAEHFGADRAAAILAR